ncbi:MAG: hypothetical protein ACYDH0_04150 [Candidatus Aminicenantales bacterium]
MRKSIAILIGAICAAAAFLPAIPPPEQERQITELPFLKKLDIPGNAGWVDTGIEVVEGREFRFTAEGEISLQKGNPEAECGPDGYDMRGIQQPLPDRNLGCVAGKVSRVVSVRIDEKTGEEFREELIRYFYIGREQTAAMPIGGRLYLGVNEDVVKDNDGQFIVSIYGRPEAPIPAD